MIIDTHQHVFCHGKDDAGLVADMDAHNIDIAWLLTWEIPPGEDAPVYHGALNPIHRRADGTHAGIVLSDLITARNNYPNRFLLGYCPDPLTGNAPALFESAYRMHGVRICGEWKFRVLFDDPRCINLYRKAGQLKCPVVLHLDVPYLTDDKGEQVYDKSWYGGTIDNLERALHACPETNFMGHAPGFWREISGDADTAHGAYPTGKVTPGGKVGRLLRQYPNLYADLSAGSGLRALKRDRMHAIAFIHEFADRLLFARDYYGGELQAFLKTLDLPQDIRQKIYCDNAKKLIHMDDATGLSIKPMAASVTSAT